MVRHVQSHVEMTGVESILHYTTLVESRKLWWGDGEGDGEGRGSGGGRGEPTLSLLEPPLLCRLLLELAVLLLLLGDGASAESFSLVAPYTSEVEAHYYILLYYKTYISVKADPGHRD